MRLSCDSQTIAYHCSLQITDFFIVLFFKLPVLIHVFNETIIFCVEQGKQCIVSVSGRNSFTSSHSPKKKGNTCEFCPDEAEKAVSLWISTGCLTLLPSWPDAQCSACTSDLLCQGFFMVAALTKTFVLKRWVFCFFFTGKETVSKPKLSASQMSVTSLD